MSPYVEEYIKNESNMFEIGYIEYIKYAFKYCLPYNDIYLEGKFTKYVFPDLDQYND